MSVEGLAILKEKEDKRSRRKRKEKGREGRKEEAKEELVKKKRKRSVSGRQKKRKIYWLVLRRHQLGTGQLCVSPTVSVVSVR